MLFNYMIKNVKDDDTRLSLLMNWLDGFKGTLFRQTQFAEFEQKIHEEVEKVMNNDPGALDKYLKFLSSGGSDYPIELLKNAGVDMTTSFPFEKTIQAMNKVMDEIETILNKREKK